ncbi:MAG: bifunctional GNAT family N-acetyltransferase/carbon-nitrogen hydrolase family protein [Salibacteraceae bacterium]|jgi:predicted amidohydrolase/ribosomal protein S18 acetylase RimI-like enzyme|nr:bifunctional GNAT family N-acetyltransferase/carbon-nitrogen hydrolase family protein [Salibacteraceae bacterium]MDP4687787.1 bifunctional GNAT family N-acetyltransferase/carbon-nitrogen hydrolase family protein [Salibacteraceae bacterium]MDP4963933.1 bifunctional GNAT family N-acetyltransferase/carbon-nitrogen hydrolase family protein [Salibacteraceae bacterium]
MQENTDEKKVVLRHLTLKDYKDLKEAMIEAYTGSRMSYWSEESIQSILQVFPEGQLCVEVNGKVVAGALSLIINYDKFGDNHTYKQITGDYSFSTHDADGDVLYGIEVFVHPEFRGLRLARRLYDARKELCENLNLSAIVAGGRISGFGKHSQELTPRQYIEKVQRNELYDPILSFQLANGFQVKRILSNYLEGDVQSNEYATLIEWNNIYYEDRAKLINREKSVVRLGLVQWQMRPTPNLDAMKEQIEFFVDAVAGYNSDFVLFPELFNAPLLAKYNHLQESQAMRELAQFTEPLLRFFRELAVAYNVNIITGSYPLLKDDKLYNISHLCRRDGSFEEYSKIHITPSEISAWGISGGDTLGVFDTDCGKIGMVICYDVEFPELGRLYAEAGVQILFVPFLTDTQNGYNRVKRCAQARAIENECYVAIAGCVGNLPKVNNMDIQYAQSAVFTPSDFAFPENAIKAQATPNTEMTLIVDVDLDLLKELNIKGSVRNLRDRRKDLYQVTLKKTS